MSLTLDQRLDRLAARLEELPCWLVREYRDLPHWTFDGEPISLGQGWPERRQAVTFAHGEIEVPPDWPLEQTRLDLDLGGEGLLYIRYPSKEEGFGLDPYHRQFPLLGRSCSLEARVVPRLPFGVPNRQPSMSRARLVLVDVTLERLIRQLRLVLDAAWTLHPADVVPHLVECAERAIDQLDWPSHTWPYLSRLRHSPQMLAIWEPPIGLNDRPPPLDDVQQRIVAEVRERLEREVRGLRVRFPQGKIALTGQAHLDLAWLWPLQETRHKARRTAHSAVGLLERFPEATFHLSSAQVYAFLKEDDPALFRAIAEKVAAGRWEPIGGMWVEPDLNIPSGESLVRQLLYGQRFFERTFGARHTVAWLPDCFGFNGALPQLLRGAGIDNFFTIKVNWSETNTFPYDLLWWEGIDGSRVLAHTFKNPSSSDNLHASPEERAEQGVGGYNGKPTPFSLIETWKNFRGKVRYPETLLSIGYGDGGGGPNGEMFEMVRELSAFPALPELRFTTVRDFYQRVRAGIQGEDLPVWVGEMYLELHRGTLTTQGRTKYPHRRAERSLVAAETLAAMTALLGGRDTDSGTASHATENAWQLVLRNEFHDILPGSSIREVYEQAEQELATADATANEIIDRALGDLAGCIGLPGNRPGLLLANPDVSERPVRVQIAERFPGAQEVAGGYLLASTKTVPGLGVRVLLHAGDLAAIDVSEHHLENDLVRVTLSPDGTLESVFDKRAQREVLAGRGNQLWAFVDKPRNWDAWDIDATYPETGEEIRKVASWSVIEPGPHRAAIRIERHVRNSSIVQEIRLWSNSARLEFGTTLDWHDRHWLLKARFPLNVRASHAIFETAFGVVERPTHRNTSWQAAQFEVAAHRFVDLSEPGFGVALLNDGKYGHHVFGNEIGLSLLRSPTYPDPLADEGLQTFTYALYPHSGSWVEGGVLLEAEDLNRPLLAALCRTDGEAERQVVSVSGMSLGLGALKPLEDGGGLALRLYEPQGARGRAEVTVPKGWSLGAELNLLEDEIGECDGTFGPFQVRTWRLERTPYRTS